jgi:2-dehydropantoate 2-reductase
MGIEKITIVGMGALGVMYGNFLTAKLGKDRVSYIADKRRIDRFKKEGILCNGVPCDFSMEDEADANVPADLLIFAVKATGLADAIHTVRNKVNDHTIILSVLNGISSEEMIGKAYGEDKLVYCVVQGMDVVKEKNEVSYSHFGQICLGIDEQTEQKNQNLQAVVVLFRQIDMPYTLENDILHRMWCKLMLNVGVNQSVMIYEGTYGTIQRPGEARDLMLSAMREVMTVAQKEHINITKKDFDDYVKLVDSLNPDGMPSMRQDGLAHRKSEVELFAGTIVALAKKHGLHVPVNQEIYDTVIKMESLY